MAELKFENILERYGWKGSLAILCLGVLIVAVLLLRWQQHGFGRGTVTIDERVTVQVEVAASDQTRRKGLAGRSSVGDDEGMLFLLTAQSRPVFWMDGMEFPLEAIWFRDGLVVDLTYGLQPPEEGQTPQRFLSAEPAGAVLEVPAGFIERHDIRIGQPATAEIDRRGGLR